MNSYKLGFFFVILAPYSTHGEDMTLKEGATGCEVAKAAIDKVTASKIFTKSENFILVRLALVSSFGTEEIVDKGSGIWQMTEENLKKAQEVVEAKNWADKIKQLLCVDFGSASNSGFYPFSTPLSSSGFVYCRTHPSLPAKYSPAQNNRKSQ